jgi:ABC-type glycerol-3-phosphate transport system substrate-binding protein
MKKTMWFLAMALCLVSAQVFAGGRSQPAAGGATETTLKIVQRLGPDMMVDNNPLIRLIREKYGFNLDLEAPPTNNYDDRIQMIMASGDLPDLFWISWLPNSNYERWAADGMLTAVEEPAKKYPNIMHNITPEQFNVARVPSDNVVYAIPKTNKINRQGMIMNKDWLDKLGSKAPTTIDEFYEYGKKVATGDPDGNGRNDTYLFSPIGNVWGSTYGIITTAFLPSESFGVPDYDGVYKIREKMDGYYPFLDYMRKLYAEKIIDPEYFVNTSQEDWQKLFQNRIALIVGHDSNVSADAPFRNGNYTFVPPIKSSDGKSRNYVVPAVWGGWALPSASKKTEDALRYIDWGNSPEGFEVLNFGVKGQTYNSYDLKNRKIDQTDAQRNLALTITSTSFTVSFGYEGMMGAISNNPVLTDTYNRELANYLANVEEVPVPATRFNEWGDFQRDNPDLVTRKTEMENKYVIGEISQNEFRTFINNEWLPRSTQYEAAYLRLMAARR